MITLTEIIANKGFEFDGTWITDIYVDETGRYEVDPTTYYNIQMK